MVESSVLITGGAGFIGSRLCARLADAAADVCAVDVLHPQVHASEGRPAGLPSGVELVPFDVTRGTAWDALLKLRRPSAVVHLAAETGTGQSLRLASRHGMVNVLGTTEMLDAFTRVGFRPQHLVLASSRAVYGEGEWTAAGASFYPPMRSHNDLARGMWDPRSPDGVPGTFLPSDAAVTKVAPSSVYAATKLAQEHICRAWCAAMEVPLTILRFQNVYGAGQSLTNPYTGVLTLFARLALTGEVIPVYEDGNITRDFVNVEDAVAALFAALSHRPDEVRVLDIGSGVPATIHEVASLLASLAGAPPPAVTGAFRDGDIRAACCRPERARDELGFAASCELRDGLDRLLSWVQRHAADEEAADTSDAEAQS